MKTGIEIIAEERGTICDKEVLELCHKYGKIPIWIDTAIMYLDSSKRRKNADKIRVLARAGALIAAEIDRLNNLSINANN